MKPEEIAAMADKTIQNLKLIIDELLRECEAKDKEIERMTEIVKERNKRITEIYASL